MTRSNWTDGATKLCQVQNIFLINFENLKISILRKLRNKNTSQSLQYYIKNLNIKNKLIFFFQCAKNKYCKNYNVSHISNKKTETAAIKKSSEQWMKNEKLKSTLASFCLFFISTLYCNMKYTKFIINFNILNSYL